MRGIRRSKKHASLADLLVFKNTKTGVAVFPSKKALQCYAAVLGFEKGKRVPIPKGDMDSIEWHTFNNDDYTDFIYLIALAEAKNVNILRYDVENSDTGGYGEDMVGIFEEYSNGGFEILQSWLDKTPSDPFGKDAIILGMQRQNFLRISEEQETVTEFEKAEF